MGARSLRRRARRARGRAGLRSAARSGGRRAKVVSVRRGALLRDTRSRARDERLAAQVFRPSRPPPVPGAAPAADLRHGAHTRRSRGGVDRFAQGSGCVSACPRCGAIDTSGRLSVCPRCLLLGVETDVDAQLPVLGPDWLKVEEELGRGGMGRVLRAHDDRLRRDVAVKILRPEGAAHPDFRARFAREARTLARLEHPGIVAVYDFGTTPSGESYLVMQLVPGGSLAERLPLPTADAATMGICEGVADLPGDGDGFGGGEGKPFRERSAGYELHDQVALAARCRSEVVNRDDAWVF